MSRILRHIALWIVLLAPANGALAQQESGPVFKRVAAPVPGSKPRIDVQINPESYFAYFNPGPEVSVPQLGETELRPFEPDATGSLPFSLFWDEYRRQGQPRSMDMIDNVLRIDPAQEPRLQTLQEIVDKFGKDILLSTLDTRVSPAFALAVIQVESAGQPDAVSPAGAQGLMQLIPATAERFGVSDALVAADNIRGGVAYLDWLMQEFEGNAVHVLAAYNAGENAVRKHGGAPPFAETRAYVPKVLAAWRVARGLCLTPPELVSDGCVFKTKEG